MSDLTDEDREWVRKKMARVQDWGPGAHIAGTVPARWLFRVCHYAAELEAKLAEVRPSYQLIALARDEGNEWGEKWERDYFEVPAVVDMADVLKRWGSSYLEGLPEYLMRHKGAREPHALVIYPNGTTETPEVSVAPDSEEG